MMELKQKNRAWHILTDLFSGYEVWTATAEAYGIDNDMDAQQYEDFFYGTNAGIHMPLWASVCFGEKDALKNKITLDVIRYYKKTGYRPVGIQMNPEDYLGEMCRFMTCLTGLILTGRDYAEIYESFADEVMTGCSVAFRKALESYPETPSVLLEMSSLMLGLLAEDERILVKYPAMTEGENLYTDWELSEPSEIEPAYETNHVSFSDCGRKCKLKASVQEGCILSIGPDTGCQEKRFVGCIRGHQYRQTYLSPWRLRYPMIRRGKRGQGLFKRITWEEAEKMIADKMTETLEKYGPGSRFVMHSAGNCGTIRGDRFMKDLLAAQGGFLNFYNFYSASCAEHVLPYIYGTDVCGNHDSEMLNSKLLVLWGHNPADTVWGDSHLDYLAQAKAKGIRIIVIDPRRSATAREYGDQWICIRPSTDGAFADAVAYEIVSHHLQDQAFLDRFCIGFDEDHMPEGVPKDENYKNYLYGGKDGIVKNAAWASEICGLPAKTIVDFALELAQAKPAWIMAGLGPQRTMNGEQNCRSTAMLAALTGNVGKSGGGAGAFQCGEGCPTPYFAARENPYKPAIPSFLWTRAIDAPETIGAKEGLKETDHLETGIKLLFNLAGGMLMNQHSDINNTIRVLNKEDGADLIVVSDLFMTPGARYADLLLPALSFFEMENIMGAWMPSDYFLYNAKAMEPLFDCRFEYSWQSQVAKRLGLYETFTKGRSQQDWLEARYQEVDEEGIFPNYETFQKSGMAYLPECIKETVAFRKQIEEGLPFETPSGKIELFSKRLYDMKDPEIPGLPCYTPCVEGISDPLIEKYPLQMTGYHSKRYCHSIGDGNHYLDPVHKPHLWIHVEDAKNRGISDGDQVEIYNDRGRVCISAYVTEDIHEGTVAMSEGGWYTPNEKGVDTRGAINVLTLSYRTTPLAKANPQHTNLVEVKKA